MEEANTDDLRKLGDKAVAAFRTNKTYYAMMRDWHRQHDGIAVERRVKRVIESHCRPGARIFDAGCGEGSATRFLASSYPKVEFYGMDVSPIGVAMASEGAPVNSRFSVGVLTATGYKDASFDLVFSQSVIEHVEDWKGMLREMYRILKPGGTLLIRVENGGRTHKHLVRALMDVVLGRNQVETCAPTFELKPGDLDAHMGNFDLHEIPSEVLERELKSLGLSVEISTCQEDLAGVFLGWKRPVVQFIGSLGAWPFKHLGYTTVAVGVKR